MPILVTLCGIFKEVKPLQPSKALSSITDTSSPNVTSLIEVNPLNHDPTTGQYIDTDSRFFHPAKASLPILVILLGITIEVCSGLQSFPDSFEFQGPRGSKYRQVGNAVPPLLAKAIADSIMKILKNEDN